MKSVALSGIGGWMLEVSARAEAGLPGFEQLGMDGEGLGQRAGRGWSAVTASGLPWPGSKITVTVASGWLLKHETAVDLAVAVAVLAAGCTVPAGQAAGVMYYAGLGVDGRLAPVPGVLSSALEAARAGCRRLVVAAEGAAEARLVSGLAVIGAASLGEVARWLCVRSAPQDAVVRSAAGTIDSVARASW